MNENELCGWKKRADELAQSLVTVAQERDAARAELRVAKAEVARLREAGTRFIADLDSGKFDSDSIAAGDDFEEALSAIDSGEWLAQHDAEVVKAERAKMHGELLAAHLIEKRAFALTERVKSLEAQLGAATKKGAEQ